MSQLLDYYHSTSDLRGEVLGRTIMLETAIGIFLARHFCNSEKRQEQILNTIFATSKITFDNKRDIMNAIIVSDYKGFLEKNKTFNSDIQKIAEYRNIFAHYPTLDNNIGLDFFTEHGAITFVKYKNSLDFEVFDFDRVTLVYQLLETCLGALLSLIDTLPKDAPSP